MPNTCRSKCEDLHGPLTGPKGQGGNPCFWLHCILLRQTNFFYYIFFKKHQWEHQPKRKFRRVYKKQNQIVISTSFVFDWNKCRAAYRRFSISSHANNCTNTQDAAMCKYAVAVHGRGLQYFPLLSRLDKIKLFPFLDASFLLSNAGFSNNTRFIVSGA